MKKTVSFFVAAVITATLALNVYGAVPESNLNGVNVYTGAALHLGQIEGEKGYIDYGDGTKEEIGADYIGLLINGSLIKNSRLTVKNSRTLLPLRLVSETLGAEVSWDESQKKVTVQDAGKKIELFIGNATATVNGSAYTLEAPPEIYYDYTYVPVRFVAESLGCEVGWFDGRATFTSQDNPILKEAHYFYRFPQVMISRYPADAVPLSEEQAIETAKAQYIKAYEKKYGKYEPLAAMPADYEESGSFRYLITNLSVISENDRFYIVDFVWEGWIDKYTGKVYKFYNGANMSVWTFDPDYSGVLAFAG
jgi:hypothetical protein